MPDAYNFSFTSSAAVIHESVMLATLFISTESWKLVREKAIQENIFQTRTSSYSERLFQEIASRLKKLEAEELRLLVEGHMTEQRQSGKRRVGTLAPRPVRERGWGEGGATPGISYSLWQTGCG